MNLSYKQLSWNKKAREFYAEASSLAIAVGLVPREIVLKGKMKTVHYHLYSKDDACFIYHPSGVSKANVPACINTRVVILNT